MQAHKRHCGAKFTRRDYWICIFGDPNASHAQTLANAGAARRQLVRLKRLKAGESQAAVTERHYWRADMTMIKMYR